MHRFWKVGCRQLGGYYSTHHSIYLPLPDCKFYVRYSVSTVPIFLNNRSLVLFRVAVAQLIKFNILASIAVQRCSVALFWPTTYKGKSTEYFLQRFCLPGEKYHSFPLWPCLRVKRIAILLPRMIGINTPGLLH